MKQVKIQWEWISWSGTLNWADDIVPELNASGLTEKHLTTCVYVIIAYGRFAIDYPKGVSPTLYIGSGNFKSRLVQHKRWLDTIIELVHEYSFSIGICCPKINGQSVHKDMEAALIHKFKEMYGCIPIRNQRMENPYNEYRYLPESAFKEPLMIGRGNRYHWAIRPLIKSNRYYKSYYNRF